MPRRRLRHPGVGPEHPASGPPMPWSPKAATPSRWAGSPQAITDRANQPESAALPHAVVVTTTNESRWGVSCPQDFLPFQAMLRTLSTLRMLPTGGDQFVSLWLLLNGQPKSASLTSARRRRTRIDLERMPEW